jgi:hypothetical protein
VAVGSPPSCLALAGVGADWPGQRYITAGSVARRACTAGKDNGVDVAAGDAAVGSVRVSVATSGTAVGLSEVKVSLCVAASGLVGVPGHVAVVGLEGIDAALWIAGVLKRSILITMPSSRRIWANFFRSACCGLDIIRLSAAHPDSVKKSLGDGRRSNRISPLSSRLRPAGGIFGFPALAPVFRVRTKNPSAAAGSVERTSSSSWRM